MADITQKNLLVAFQLEVQKAKRELIQFRDEVNGIEDSAESFKETMTEALENKVVKDFLKEFEKLGVEIEDAEAAAAGIREELQTTFDPSNPEAYAEALTRVSNQLENVKSDINTTTNRNNRFLTSVINVRNAFRASQRVASRFFRVIRTSGRLAFNVFKSFALGALADIGLQVTAFGRSFRETLSGTAAGNAFDQINTFLGKIGSDVARTLTPLIQQIGDFFGRLTTGLNFSSVQRSLTILIVSAQRFVRTLLDPFLPSGEAGNITSFIDSINRSIINVIANLAGLEDIMTRFQLVSDRTALSFRVAFLDFVGSIEPILNQLLGFTEAILRLDEGSLGRLSAISGVIESTRKEIAGVNEELAGLEGNFSDRVAARRAELLAEIEAYEAKVPAAVRSVGAATAESSVALAGSIDFLDREIQNLQRALNAATTDEERLRAAVGIDELKKIRVELELELKRLKASLDGLLDGLGGELPQLNFLESITSETAIEDLEKSNKEFLKRIADFYARLDRLEAERKAKLLKTLDDIETIQTAFGQGTAEVFNAASDALLRQIELYDRLIDVQQERVDKALVLAERGNAEILQLEQERLDKMIAAREDAQRRQEQIDRASIVAAQAVAVSQGIVAVIRGFAELGPIGGIAAAIGLAASVAAAIIQLNQAFSSIPSFRKGTEEYIPGPAHQGHIIEVHGGERVLTAEQNKALGGRALSNEQLVELAQMGAFIQDIPISKLISPSPLVVDSKRLRRQESDNGITKEQFKTLIDEVRRVKKSIQEIEVNFGITEGGIFGSYNKASSQHDYQQNLIG